MIATIKTAQGKIHGKTIQLDADLGIPDGQQVEIVVRVSQPKQTWGEGIRRSAGIAANVPGADEAFDQIARERKAAQFRESAE